MKIIRAENGIKERKVDVMKITIPDVWNLIHQLYDTNHINAYNRDALLENWHLSHDMLGALQSIARGADLKEPIHTK